jgi:hypothetical protein
VKEDKLTSNDVRQLNQLVYMSLPRVEGLVICRWVCRIEEDEALVQVLWQHDSERIVIRDVRVRLARGMAAQEGDPDWL